MGISIRPREYPRSKFIQNARKKNLKGRLRAETNNRVTAYISDNRARGDSGKEVLLHIRRRGKLRREAKRMDEEFAEGGRA